MKRFAFGFAASALSIALIGCGGSGTPTNTNTGGPSNSLRTNANGDTYTYAVSGTYSDTTTSASNVSTTGTATEGFTTTNFNGSFNTLNDTITTTIALQGGSTSTLTDTKLINSSSLVVGQYDAGAVSAVVGTGFTVPATLGASTNVTGTETLADGTTVTLSYQVTGTKSITTAGSTFACWSIAKNVRFSTGFISSQVIYFAPSIGAAVQFTVSNTYTNGFSDTLTYNLSTYHLATPAI